MEDGSRIKHCTVAMFVPRARQVPLDAWVKARGLTSLPARDRARLDAASVALLDLVIVEPRSRGGGREAFGSLSRLRELGFGGPSLYVAGPRGSKDEQHARARAQAEALHAFERGATSVLEAPVADEIVTIAAEQLLRVVVSRTGPICQHDDLLVRRGKVYRGGTLCEVSPSELALLEHFLVRLGQVVSYDELMDHCVGLGLKVTRNAINGRVSRLRAAIFDRARRILVTVPGVGFGIGISPERERAERAPSSSGSRYRTRPPPRSTTRPIRPRPSPAAGRAL
jgi:DNA-binding winged helix-turn-helix (wHTH) protein